MAIVAGVVFFLLAFALMAVGLLHGKALRGSCGGAGGEGGACTCSPAKKAACDLEKVKRAAEAVQAARLSADADDVDDEEPHALAVEGAAGRR